MKKQCKKEEEREGKGRKKCKKTKKKNGNGERM